MSYKVGRLNKTQLKVFVKMAKETKSLISKMKQKKFRIESIKTFEDANWLIKESLKSINETLKEKKCFLEFFEEEIKYSKIRLRRLGRI
jgi:hypothetical protein